jgi:hypothetical protein
LQVSATQRSGPTPRPRLGAKPRLRLPVDGTRLLINLKSAAPTNPSRQTAKQPPGDLDRVHIRRPRDSAKAMAHGGTQTACPRFPSRRRPPPTILRAMPNRRPTVHGPANPAGRRAALRGSRPLAPPFQQRRRPRLSRPVGTRKAEPGLTTGWSWSARRLRKRQHPDPSTQKPAPASVHVRVESMLSKPQYWALT